MEAGLKYRYHQCWDLILEVIGVVFEVCLKIITCWSRSDWCLFLGGGGGGCTIASNGGEGN